MRILLALASCLLLGVLLVSAVLLAPAPGENLPQKLAETLPDAGVEHPVTAVLLDFRSLDTLLEIGVLLIAAITALSSWPVQTRYRDSSPSPLLVPIARLLAPVMVLVCGWLLWAGSYQPGGAFQAGAVLAATLVLLRLAGILPTPWLKTTTLKFLLCLGFLVFLLAGILVMIDGNVMLQWPTAWAGTLILTIEAALTLSIGMILFSLFTAAPPTDSKPGDAP